jgi:BRK domain
MFLMQGGETPTYVRKKQHVRRPKYTDDDRGAILDPDSRVPVMSLDGQHVISGNDAPALRDLQAWLEEHPNYAPLGDVNIDVPLVSMRDLLD